MFIQFFKQFFFGKSYISIDNDVETAKNNLLTALATMDYQKQNMQLAELVYDQTKKKYEIGVAIENLFNVKWNETQFDTESRLKDEPAPVTEIHFTPGTPFFA